ncbi:conserved hypothetical protein [Renibacterium salmoninarum ATCC 33209]|uniref:Glyoxalase-like domain-containing protein n=2 Tax=Renibacterium salmoninarum TaxID=1646 RepID=A9WM48_RENSM|nr:conserved hypothetical protein [Renibacterium salmoninarum ATCC 33209]
MMRTVAVRNGLCRRRALRQAGFMIAQWDNVSIDTEDSHGLAVFYAEITGLPIIRDDDDWAAIGHQNGMKICFQKVENHVPPNWPEAVNGQQMHLEFEVADLVEAEPKVLALGAQRVGGFDTGFRVYLDPAGHPFCLVD